MPLCPWSKGPFSVPTYSWAIDMVQSILGLWATQESRILMSLKFLGVQGNSVTSGMLLDSDESKPHSMLFASAPLCIHTVHI